MDNEFDSYVSLGSSIGKLVQDKQKAYGDSFSKAPKIMAVLYPNGIGSDQMGSALTIVRIIDKLNRISTNKVDLMGENPWRDIAGYSLLEVMKNRPTEDVALESKEVGPEFINMQQTNREMELRKSLKSMDVPEGL